MTPVLEATPHAPPPTAGVVLPTPEPDQRFVLDDVSWDAYEAIGDALPDRGGLRLTYDRGRLELMGTSYLHERLKYLIGRLIDVLGDDLDMAIAGAGQTTFKRKDRARGFEPDQCYYSISLPRVAGKRRIDLAVDPPPDLTVEIDVTNSSVDRMATYAAIGVPEVWRVAGGTITAHELTADGTYTARPASPRFLPGFNPADLVPFLEIGLPHCDAAMARAFRAWVREWVANRPSAGGSR